VRLPFALAQHTDAVVLLGHVDQIKVGGEGPGDTLCLFQVHLVDETGEIVVDAGTGIAAPGFAQRPDALLEVEDGNARLLADDTAKCIA
jgi:hypothetical protein